MAEKRKVYFDNRPTLPHIAPYQMSKTRHVRIQGYICDKLLSFYANNHFAPSLTNIVNRELAAAINAKPPAKRKVLNKSK